MNEPGFEAAHAAEWQALAVALEGKRRSAPAGAAPQAEVPRRFRRVVAQLALARDRQYRTSLIDRLHALVISAHLAIHGARARRGYGTFSALWQFIFETFPREARREWRFVLTSAVALFGPFLGLLAAIQFHPDFVYYVVAPDTLAQVQSMYAPGNTRLGAGREADTDLAMFGFYIFNNVRIDLQCLAGGIFFGLGTLFFLVV
ncbi:MAG TPA: stage II sporulation protein M, partial [Usitatibacter sp.]|nr:stage II sporulation protein M [Usitatibacter sp.]